MKKKRSLLWRNSEERWRESGSRSRTANRAQTTRTLFEKTLTDVTDSGNDPLNTERASIYDDENFQGDPDAGPSGSSKRRKYPETPAKRSNIPDDDSSDWASTSAILSILWIDTKENFYTFKISVENSVIVNLRFPLIIKIAHTCTRSKKFNHFIDHFTCFSLPLPLWCVDRFCVFFVTVQHNFV